MAKIIEPIDPEEVNAALDQNTTPEQPPATAPANPTILNTAPQQTSVNQDERKRKRYKIINLMVLALILAVFGFIGWHVWVVPNNKAGKTILGKPDQSTLMGINQGNPDVPDMVVKIPVERQAYSIENGGYKYTFNFLKDSNTPKYTGIDLQEVFTPAGPYTLDVWIKPSDEQKKLVCEKNLSGFTVKTINVLGQDYPLCGEQRSGTKLSSSYNLRFYYLDTWHEMLLYHVNHGLFTDQLALDVLNSLKVEKL